MKIYKDIVAERQAKVKGIGFFFYIFCCFSAILRHRERVFSLFLFTYAIIRLPNELNIIAKQVYSLQGDTIPFFRYTLKRFSFW